MVTDSLPVVPVRQPIPTDTRLKGTRLRGFTGRLRTVGWMAAVAFAAVMASERVYWYWSGVDADSLSVLTTFYLAAAAVALSSLALVPGHKAPQVVLGGAAFALVVEGIITPVIYEDGPLPVLFIMFVGWHGLLALGGFVYLIRRWALARRVRLLAGAAVGTGVGWGVWALSSGVTDRETALEIAADGGSAAVLAPGEFGVYALWVGGLLIAAHVLMDRLWPARGWRPSRPGLIATGVGVLVLAGALVIPAVPWAPVKLLAIAWAIRWLLRRTAAPIGTPTVIDDLAGRVRVRDLAPLMLLPISATGIYAALWPLRESAAMALLFNGLIAAQVLAGAAAAFWILRTARKAGRPAG